MSDRLNLHPDHQLCLAYARSDARLRLEALFRIDSFLSRIGWHSREALLGQIKLAWWKELGFKEPGKAAELADSVSFLYQADGLQPDDLARLADAWSAVIGHECQAFEDHGELLFGLAAQLAGGPANDGVKAAGRLWGLAFHGRVFGDETALEAARLRGIEQGRVRLNDGLRPLAVLSALARSDAENGLKNMTDLGSPRRMLTALGQLLFKF